MEQQTNEIQFTEQQKKALDLKRNLIVTAGAGSGKTTILVERFFKILLFQPQISVQNILAITFTEKAASEMKQRIVEKIYHHFETDPRNRERLFKIIKSISEIQISTIHAFCNRILRENLLHTRLNPDFRIALNPEMDQLLSRVFWQFFHSYQPESDDELQLSLTPLRELEVPKIKKLFFDCYYKRTNLADFIHQYAKDQPDDLIENWRRLRSKYYQSILEPLFSDGKLVKNLEIIRNGLRFNSGAYATRFVAAIEEFLSAARGSLDKKIAALSNFLKELFTQKGAVNSHHRKNIEKCDDSIRDAFENVAEKLVRVNEYLIPDNQDETEVVFYAQAIHGLSRLLQQFFHKVEEDKQRRQILDFDDLLIKTRDLLKSSPKILNDLRQRYQWILVDEFQDTDAVQSEIIQLLNTDQNNMFFVGDPKQSIYSFRQADVSIFQEQLKSIQRQQTEGTQFIDDLDNQILFSNEKERKGIIELPDNFRSTRSLIQFYNFLFEKVLEPESEFDVEFNPLSFPGLIKEKVPSKIELHLINCRDKLNQAEYTPHEIYETIEIIKSIVGKQKRYNPETFRWETIEYKDIAILSRDRHHWTELIHALQVAEIPFETYQGAGFFQTREVQDIYYLLKAVADPQDNFALVTTLRSPFIGVSDAGIFYLSRCKGRNYSERLQQIQNYLNGQSVEDCFNREFVEFLKTQKNSLMIIPDDGQALKWAAELFPRWHLSAHRGEFSLLLNEMIETFNIPAVLQADEFGEQKIANLNKLRQFTYDYERSSSRRITDFLDIFLALMQGRLPEGEATLYTEEGNQVNILTIHGAKGLEFPVVILPFLENKFKTDEDIFYQKNKGLFFKLRSKSKTGAFIGNYFSGIYELQRIAEEKRLLYVASTRARDHLFLIGATGIGQEPKINYLRFLLNSLEIDPDTRQASEKRLKEKFGFDVFQHPISKNSEEPIFTKTDRKVAAEEEEILPDRETLLKYSRKLQPPIQHGEYSVTQLMIYEEDPERYIHYHYFKNGNIYPPNLEEAYTDEPGGLWWGTLVHKALENFHKRPSSEDSIFVEKLINQFGIPEKDIPGLQTELLSLLDRFRKTKMGEHLLNCEQQSEVRAAMRFPRGLLIGILDRLFKNENGIWEVLDFKTNRISKAELSSLVKKYSPQVSYYALLLANLFPQQKTYPVRLYFFSIDEEYRKEFSAEDIAGIHPKAETTIKKIQKIEEKFFGISVDSERQNSF